jgi:membrane protein required for colicin V production
MSGADWLILIVILASTIEAARSGFFQEVFGIAGLVFGYLLAAWQYRRLSDWFSTFLKSPWLADIVAFLIIFMVVLLVAGIAGRIARWAMKESGLSLLDRILGGAIGLLKGSLMVAVILMSMAAFTPTSKWLESSQLAPYFLVVGRAGIWVAPAEMRARFYQGLDLLHRQNAPTKTGAAAGSGREN